ncbi:hypothetical protein NBRC110019_13250 [Neptunitalea chrysea]|uniref:DUF985 domain-containing protein n=1 Tax=Neptunitalea chrysea TaxID=1647581 RepID=A0A9W6B4B4_9FLAO|nr:cupin domain-containing protein [Neptunitalea chrysea]GLB52286.1 hypothetical protein NBRC110019_13250 [Neptunitalea chrysea]
MSLITTIIKQLQLEAHPEGGYYRETYRSEETILEGNLQDVYSGDRNVSTCIYFLLPSNEFSAFHKINQDEIWHFYEGSTIRLVMISEAGELSEVRIGRNITQGEVPQFVVPKNYWFAAKVIAKDSFALAGCTVAPGFDFRDFTMPTREELLKFFPQHTETITEFTR